MAAVEFLCEYIENAGLYYLKESLLWYMNSISKSYSVMSFFKKKQVIHICSLSPKKKGELLYSLIIAKKWKQDQSPQRVNGQTQCDLST